MAMASSDKYQVEEVSPENSSLQPFPIGDFGIPCNWDSNNHTKHSHHQPYTLVRLSDKCWEYTSIESEFGRAGAKILRVDRIENKELWERFDAENKRMLRTRTAVNEVYLLHGSKGNTEDICHEGLDQRLARIGHFGRGIYFSNDVRKCFSYTKNNESIDGGAAVEERKCTIYKCRALLGIVKLYEKGQNAKHLKREPKLDTPGPGALKYYDSVKGQISEFEEYIVYKSERVLPEYIITCLPPNTSSLAGSSQPAATVAMDIVQSLPNLPTTNGNANSGSPTNSVHSVDLDDEESWEVQHLKSNSAPSAHGEQKGKASKLVARGVGGAHDERSKSVEEDNVKEETCESAEEDVFESPEEDMCESAEEDVKSDDDLYSAASSLNLTQQSGVAASVSNQDTAAAASNVSNQDSTAHDSTASTSSLSPMFKDEDEFQKHLLEVRRRVREKRRAEEAAQALLGGDNKVPAPAPVRCHPPPPVQLDDDHQRRLLEVRKRVRERRMKEGKLSTDEASTSVEEKEDEKPEDNVQEVMSSLLAQFLEFTGCDDSEVATRYIRHAQMDVNDAIMMYINATSV